MSATFKTSDGYTLHLVGGVWVDNLDPDLVDMTFESRWVWHGCVWSIGAHPVDHNGEMLDGRLVEVTS